MIKVIHIRKALLLFACCLLFVCFGSLSAYAQRYPFFNFNVENGLIQSQPNSLAQDKYGNLWIGTIGGLSKYDGKTCVNYTIRNGLPDNNVQAVAADEDGNIWIGSPGEIYRFNGKTCKQYIAAANNTGGTKEIKIVNKDSIWYKADGRVFCVAHEKITQLILPDSNAHVTALLPDTGGIWIAKEGIVYNYHHLKWDSLLFQPQNSDVRPPYVTKIFKDHEGRIWITTNRGLYHIDSGKIAVRYVNRQPLNNIPTLFSITEDHNGTLWMGTSSGVIHLSGNQIQYYNKRNGLSDNTFYDILTDSEGDIWMACDGQGIFRYSGTQFTGLDESMGLPSAQIMAIAADHGGQLFLGTYDAGLYKFGNGLVSPIAFPSNPMPSITALCMTRDGKLWIGTRGQGLWRYDKVFKNYMAPGRHFPSNLITALYSDTSGKFFIGFNQGAVVFANDTFKKIPINSSVYSFLTIGNDSVLIATDKGIQIYNGGGISSYKTHSAPDSSIAECFVLLKDELWIGTGDNGVICYNLKTGKSYAVNKANGLQSDFIYNIIADDEGNIWVGTGYGIHKISRKDGGEPVVTFYGKGQGITGMESNHNSVMKLRDGSIWFGTTNGALHYQPHSQLVSSQPASIILQSVKLFGEPITDTTCYDSTDNWNKVPYHLRLPYKKNNITFSFQAVSLSGNAELRYRYRIDGLDAPWSDWSGINSVTYSALPPGEYILRVECGGTAGGQKIRELTYPFEIITPFQKTGWFRLLLFGACILLGIALQYIANRRKLLRQQLLDKLRAEEQAKIRMRTAEDFHDEVGNKLTRINILTNVLRSKLGAKSTDINRILDQIEDNSGQLYSGTRDILWSLTPSNDNLYEILHRIRDFGNELFSETETGFTFTGTNEAWQQYRLPLDVSRNLIMIFKEALNNCLKYSHARHVKLEVILKRKDVLQLILTDDGTGFDTRNEKRGHGINNMNVRAERIHGRLYIDSRKDKGTIISLTFKIPLKRGYNLPENSSTL